MEPPALTPDPDPEPSPSADTEIETKEHCHQAILEGVLDE